MHALSFGTMVAHALTGGHHGRMNPLEHEGRRSSRATPPNSSRLPAFLFLVGAAGAWRTALDPRDPEPARGREQEETGRTGACERWRYPSRRGSFHAPSLLAFPCAVRRRLGVVSPGRRLLDGGSEGEPAEHAGRPSRRYDSATGRL